MFAHVDQLYFTKWRIVPDCSDYNSARDTSVVATAPLQFLGASQGDKVCRPKHGIVLVAQT